MLSLKLRSYDQLCQKKNTKKNAFADIRIAKIFKSFKTAVLSFIGTVYGRAKHS